MKMQVNKEHTLSTNGNSATGLHMTKTQSSTGSAYDISELQMNASDSNHSYIKVNPGDAAYFDVRFTNPDVSNRETMALVTGSHDNALPWSSTGASGTQNQYFYQLYLDVPAQHAPNTQFILARTPSVNAISGNVDRYNIPNAQLFATNSAGLPTATININLSNSTRVDRLLIDGKNILEDQTDSTSNSVSLAVDLMNLINKCTNSRQGDCSIAGYSATLSGTTLTITAPAILSGLTSTPVIDLNSGRQSSFSSSSFTTTANVNAWAPAAGNTGVGVAGDLVNSGTGVTASDSKTGYTMRFKYQASQEWSGTDWVVAEAKMLCSVHGVQPKHFIKIPVSVLHTSATKDPTINVSSASCSNSNPHIGCAQTSNSDSHSSEVGNMSEFGATIIDNTPNPGQPGMLNNMKVSLGGSNLNISNTVSFEGIHIMQRQPDNSAYDEMGTENTNSVSQNNFGTAQQSTFFPNGESVLQLQRYRQASNWIRVNKAQDHEAGTITWQAFVDNVTHSPSLSMYGFTRVLVPLTLQKQFANNVYENNSLGQTVQSNKVYSFCQTGIPSEKSCEDEKAPYDGIQLQAGKEQYVGESHEISADNHDGSSTTPASVTVFGQLFFDFVDLDSYNNNTLNNFNSVNADSNLVYTSAATLPFRPNNILFETPIPFNINPAKGKADNIHSDKDSDDYAAPRKDYAMNLDYILDITKRNYCDANGTAAGFSYCTYPYYKNTATTPYANSTSNNVFPTYDTNGRDSNNMWFGVDTSVEKRFQYQTNLAGTATNLTLDNFNGLNRSSQYHALFPTGYEQGWLRAFNILRISPSEWNDTNKIGFGMPTSIRNKNSYKDWNNGNTHASCSSTSNNSWCSSHEEKNDESLIRDRAFEDIPAYISTGGLFQLRGDVNISGILYIPQALELLHDEVDTRQYLMGGAIVRDGFNIRYHWDGDQHSDKGCGGYSTAPITTSDEHDSHVDTKSCGITVISSDPMTYNNIPLLTSGTRAIVLNNYSNANGLGGGNVSNPALASGANSSGIANCFGCTQSLSSTASNATAKRPSYVIIKP